ncbi:hypothetical protein [Streptomyces sp. NPDC051132]|uniref:hypothetical protein n=1 Tax=unclassified Streptomyces TaxID=2593676 RepID=UPI00343D9A91
MADAQITLTYSRNVGVVAIATGKHYESAEEVLSDTGFRWGEAGAYRLPDADETAVRKALGRLVQSARASGIEVAASSRRFIGDAARDIARLLPGQWDTQVEIYSHPVWREDLIPYLWDSGELVHAVRAARIPYAATLTNRACDTTLLLTERPGHRFGYLVGAIAPEAFGEVDGSSRAPRSIIVPPLPGPATQAITDRYLPAYERVVHERRITVVAEALGLIRSELDARHEPRSIAETGGVLPADSGSSATEAGAFLDRAWREFLTVLDHAPVLLERCRPAASFWPQDAEALGRLAAALLTAQETRDDLNNGVLSRADHHQRAWPVIATWLTHSDSFLRQARAAAPCPPPAPAPASPPPRALPAGQPAHHL